MKNYCLFRYDAVYLGRLLPIFESDLQLPFSGLKMEAVHSSETLVNICRATRCHIPKDSIINGIVLIICNNLSLVAASFDLNSRHQAAMESSS
jgi:hypothetical protein